MNAAPALTKAVVEVKNYANKIIKCAVQNYLQEHVTV